MEFIKTYKTYLITIFITIMLLLGGYLLFKPAQQYFDHLILSNKQVKTIIKDNERLQKLNQQSLDTAQYYRELAKMYSKSVDSSKTITIYIEKQTNETVNNIPTISVDSNINQFPSDMEQYLSSRNKANK